MRARECLEQAVKEDPDYAEAWGWLAILYSNEHALRFNVREDPLGRALDASQKAILADRASQMAWEGKAAAHFFRGEWDEFDAAAQKAVSINPNDVSTIPNMAWYYGNFGDYEKSLPLMDKAMSLSPYPVPWMFHPYWHKAYLEDDHETALEFASKSESIGFFPSYIILSSTFAQSGELERARDNLNILLKLKPDIADTYGIWTKSWNWPDRLANKVADGLRMAGLDIPDPPSAN